MLIIILPGGVSHALAGCCIAAIIIPVTPTTPLKVKKPPLIILFIVVSSYKNIMVPNVISTQGASSPFHNSIGTGSSSRMVGIFFFELLQSFKRFCADCVFNATGFLFCGFRVNTGLHQHRREELVLFQCDFGDRTARFGQDQETTFVHSQKSFRTQRGNRVAYTWLRYLQMLCYIHRPYHPHSPLKE